MSQAKAKTASVRNGSQDYLSRTYWNGTIKMSLSKFFILCVLHRRPMHGYDIARMIEVRSKGALAFHAASMYPLLYRLERRGLIKGRWVEKAGERRRRLYRITAKGRDVLAAQRSGWREFVEAVNRVTAGSHA